MSIAPWLVLLVPLLSCCGLKPAANPHYVLGTAYRAGGVWHYPAENYDLNETGLAAVLPDAHTPLTSNGEVFDQSVVAAAHPTLQLPAIARLTNLENGRSILVRINDRGTGDPHRLVQVTRRTVSLLGMAEAGATRVRLEVLPADSHAAADAMTGAPRLAVTAAPRGAVEAAELPPPPGARQQAPRSAPSGVAVQAAAEPVAARIGVLPETVTQGVPPPTRLWVRLDTFEEYQYAAVQRARLAGLSPHISKVFEHRREAFRVDIGPLDSVAQADRALDQALAANVPDARIVVE